MGFINSKTIQYAANTKQIYVDANFGSDVAEHGRGGVLQPYQTIQAALAAIALLPAGDYVLELAAGDYGGAPIAWPSQSTGYNVGINGSGTNCSISAAISLTSGVGANEQIVWQNVGITANSIVVDFTNAAVATMILANGGFAVDRIDSLPPGPQAIRIFDSLITTISTNSTVIVSNGQWIGGAPNVIGATGNLLIQGGLAAAMVYNVAAGGQLLIEGSIASFSTFNIDGTLTLLGTVAPGATIGGAGSLIADASSLSFGAAITVASRTLADYAPNSFVFQPGGTDDFPGRVFTSWADLYAAAQATVGPKTIFFDDSFVSPCVIPAGAYALEEVTFDNAKEGNTSDVQVADGVSWTGVRKFNNINIEFLNTATVETLPAEGLQFNGCVVTANGTAAIWENAAGAQFQLYKGSSFQGSATAACVNIQTGQTLQLVLAQVSNLNALAISSPAADPTAVLVVLRPDETGGFTAQGAQFGGTTSDVPLQDAQYLFFNPGVPADWITPPTQVAQALNELAARPVAKAPSTFVFQEGGVTSGNVYATWAELMTALAAAGAGPKTIMVMNTFTAPCVIPAGAHDLSGCTIVGEGSADTLLEFADGASIVGAFFGFEGRLTITSVSSSPVITAGASSTTIFARNRVTIKANGTAPFFSVPNFASLYLELDGYSIGLDGATDPVVYVDAGGILNAVTVGGSYFQSAAINGVGTLNVSRMGRNTKYTRTLDAGDIVNQYIDLPDLINEDSLQIAWNYGLPVLETDDYTLSTVAGVTRLTFVPGGLLATFAAAGQKIQNKYLY